MRIDRHCKKAAFSVAFFIAAGLSPFAHAQKDFLDGSAISALLNDAHVISAKAGEPWSQTFSRGGETRYVNSNGEPSNGAWSIQGDRYCSLWPPSNSWDCYRVRTALIEGRTHIIWVSNSGFETTGIVASD